MTTIDLRLFPYPVSQGGIRVNGSLQDWPELCESCPTRECEKGSLNITKLCSFGFNYHRVTHSLMVGGVVLGKWSVDTPARRKQIRRVQKSAVRDSDFNRALDLLGDKAAKVMAIQVTSDVTAPEFIEKFKAQILQGLSFVHDYKQINSRIVQNVNILIESERTGSDFDEKLEKSSTETKSIYYAAKLLEEKLNISQFLLMPEWLTDRDAIVAFRPHRMVLKYLRLYQSSFDTKRIKVKVKGLNSKDILANPKAAGVIPHTFIDNALKYSPPDSEVLVRIHDVTAGVEFSVGSYGPAMTEIERAEIFGPFYRGSAAREITQDGAGYGLYVSQLVARRHLGTEIAVSQDPGRSHDDGRVWTVFSVLFPSRAAVL